MNDTVNNKGRIIDGYLQFINPATGEIFGKVKASKPKDATETLEKSRKAAEKWSALPLSRRISILKKLYAHIMEKTDEITLTITQDTGKTRQDALIELLTTMNYFNTTLKKAPKWLKDEKVSTGLQFMKRAYITRRPYGIVAVIAPWNYPFVLTMNPILGALIAGNSVIVKGSEVTSAVNVLMEELFAAIPELDGIVRFLHGDGSIGAALVEARPDLIFVTGSVRTGQLISKAAADTLIPVICELGGKDPMIVLDDADIETAVRWGAWGAFANSGQTCMSPERIYVVEKIYDQFIKALQKEIESMKIGYSDHESAAYHYGSITFPKQRNIVTTQIEDARKKGARVLTGGKGEGMFYEPTLITDITDEMLLMKEETFGAVMPVIKVKDEKEAIAKANNSEFGLSASVFSKSNKRADRVARQLQVGAVNINDTMSHYGIPELPFGGVKQSGHSRSNGKIGLQEFTYTMGIIKGKPRSFDVATQVRNPGNYRRARGSLYLTLGKGIGKRLAGLRDLLQG